ncbi:hypothetical protein QWI44_02745 [Acinetobacter pittii]|uniref:hypothetical protein n=1 Tax=Acinetobacter pittii TaxID=48296 RepID=UPI002740AAB9|nr:hypothetical protein [Acinetobacter pittii]MDP7899614.1 hypothetical protein [Acinetobacter pittii]
MDNYKIKVKDEAESKEVQELFEELGYKIEVFVPAGFPRWVATTDSGEGYWYSTGFDFIAGLSEFKELNLPQLRDLVVLKRNDVKDANYRSKSVPDGFYFKSCDGVFYFMFEGKWVRSTTNTDEGLEPITKGSDLISGADALRALADGVKPEEIEGRFSSGIETYFLSMDGKVDVFLKYLNKKLFRLKPQTVKVELELPKPFEPEEDCHVYILDDGKTDGYRRYSYEVHGDKGNEFIGIWKTEDEIKQVVEQLRKIRGTNS